MKGNQILVLFRLKIPRYMEKKQALGTNKKVATSLILLLIFWVPATWGIAENQVVEYNPYMHRTVHIISGIQLLYGPVQLYRLCSFWNADRKTIVRFV